MLNTILTVALAVLPQHWSGTLPLEGITSLEIDNAMGKVTVIGVDEKTISAEAEVVDYQKFTGISDFEKTKIDFFKEGDKATLSLDVPKKFHVTDPPKVNFTVKVPADLACHIYVISDGVEIRNSLAANTVSLVNGNLHITSAQPAGSYECVNGSITIDATSVLSSGSLLLRTINGPITVNLLKGSIVNTETQTMNGEITLPSGWDENALAAKSAVLKAETINGKITVAEVESLK